MSEESYEREQLEKLAAVVRAGQLNPTTQGDINISTEGHDPSASVSINADLLAKFLKLK